jgi:ribonucleoside-diphosphate reductase alpha chain
MNQASPFIDLAAVEGWDAWFRWREQQVLRDVSIQDTWTRVARFIVGQRDRAISNQMECRLLDAMATWRLLLDERVLSSAGTGHEAWPASELVAVLNMTQFVNDPGLPSAHIDMHAIESTAALAVEVLDNAAEKARWLPGSPGRHLRIGLIGLADAFLLLGIAYGSPLASRFAHDISQHLAAGCLAASVRLARDRGSRCQISRRLPVAYKLRELSPSLATDAIRYGLRQSKLTAITSQPHLAQLANNVTNAVDPLPRAQYPSWHASPRASGMTGSSGYAIEWFHRHGASPARLSALLKHADANAHAQIALRASMQMWIDEPILYPLSNHCQENATADVDMFHD